MDIKIEKLEGCMVLALNGRLDPGISLRLGDRIDFEIEKRTGGEAIDFNLIVDMEKVPYISSGGVRVLLQLHNKMRAADRRLAVCNLQSLVAQVISVSGFFGLFNIYPSVRDALKIGFNQ